MAELLEHYTADARTDHLLRYGDLHHRGDAGLHAGLYDDQRWSRRRAGTDDHRCRRLPHLLRSLGELQYWAGVGKVLRIARGDRRDLLLPVSNDEEPDGGIQCGMRKGAPLPLREGAGGWVYVF